jgi:hypothetical protein
MVKKKFWGISGIYCKIYNMINYSERIDNMVNEYNRLLACRAIQEFQLSDLKVYDVNRVASRGLDEPIIVKKSVSKFYLPQVKVPLVNRYKSGAQINISLNKTKEEMEELINNNNPQLLEKVKVKLKEHSDKFFNCPHYDTSVNEQLGPIVKKLLGKGVKPMVKMEIPLLNQLPNEIQSLISSFPRKVKVGDKLKGVFDKHSSDIKSLKHYIGSQGGVSDTYARLLANDISVPKGGVVNLQDVYSNAQILKKELENIKSSIPMPKQGGVLNKNPKYEKQMEDLYNKFFNETATLNNFISDLEKIKSTYKPK